jgi:prepilin-type processing-associated H-X9-DG protein/prepilin-type N-terminal cleavage/methylation domain-containing protein
MITTSYRWRRGGFSLLELLVVIGIVGTVAGLLLPAIMGVRESAARVGCLANLKQLGLALHEYHDTHGAFPPFETRLDDAAGSPGRPLSWQVLILPYLENNALWQHTLEAYQLDTYPLHNPPHVGLATFIPPYACPSDARLRDPLTDQWGNTATYTSYIGAIGGTRADGLFGWNFPIPRITRISDITDGTSTTIAVGERPPPLTLEAGWWYSLVYPSSGPGQGRGPDAAIYARYGPVPEPGSNCIGLYHFGIGRLDNPCDRYHYWSLHSNGANFLMADGSARFLSYAAEPLIIPLSTIAGGEEIALPD